MTDTQWTLLRPEAEAVMAELRRSPAGRPMEHDLRAMSSSTLPARLGDRYATDQET